MSKYDFEQTPFVVYVLALLWARASLKDRVAAKWKAVSRWSSHFFLQQTPLFDWNNESFDWMKKSESEIKSKIEEPFSADHPFILQQTPLFDQNNGIFNWRNKSESEKMQSEKLCPEVKTHTDHRIFLFKRHYCLIKTMEAIIA